MLSIATEVCRTHAQQKPLSNAYSRTTWSSTSIIAWFYFSTTTITDTQGIGKILLPPPHYCSGTCTTATRTEETAAAEWHSLRKATLPGFPHAPTSPLAVPQGQYPFCAAEGVIQQRVRMHWEWSRMQNHQQKPLPLQYWLSARRVHGQPVLTTSSAG